MKKTLALILALLMLLPLVLASCDAGQEEPFDDIFTADELIRNAALWNGKRLADDKFQFILEYTNDKVEEDGLGVSYNHFGGDFLHTPYAAGEWGNALLYLDGQLDGAGVLIDSPFRKGGNPETEEEALRRTLEFLHTWISKKTAEDTLPTTAMNSGWAWCHYAGMAGYENIGVELGSVSPTNQLKIAMARGTAKQYDTTWFVDYSPWFHNDCFVFMDGDEKVVGDNSKTGHSLSMVERSFLLSIMGGADAVIAEAGSSFVYYPDGTFSPYGDLCKKLHDFEANNDLGTAYTPFAIILDTYHGLDDREKHLGVFENEPADLFTYDFFDKILWNDTIKWDMTQEAHNMANGKFGDLFDFFLPDVSAELLATYPALIFTGDIKLTAEELETYGNYVNNGGIIVLNTAQTGIFADKIKLPSEITGDYYDEIKSGKGSFIVFGKGGKNEQFDPALYSGQNKGDLDFTKENLPDLYADYEKNANLKSDDWSIAGLTPVLTELYSRFVPFTLSEEIGYCISVADGKLLLCLYNNDGVTKTDTNRAIYDESKAIDLTVTYTGPYTLRSAKDIYNGHEVKTDGKTMQLHLGAGDMAVIELLIGKQ